MTKTKIRSFFAGNLERLDTVVNTWAEIEPVRILHVQLSAGSGYGLGFVYTVLYEDIKVPHQDVPAVQTVSRQIVSRLRRNYVPTVEALSCVQGEAERRVECMAGIFGVPEGWKLTPEDTEAAPVVCLSPDCNLEPYADLFGNLEDV